MKPITPVPLPAARNNNFNMIRLLAAFCVMAGHMGYIAGTGVPAFADIQVNSLGVSVLFLMSGYLNAKSWKSDPHFGRFTLKRFVRLWPPFAVSVLLMVYVAGPLVSELGPAGYFASWYKAFLDNLRFKIVFALPGVFQYSEANPLPYPNTVNGSYWTMPVEAVCYLLCPLILFVLSRIRNPRTRKACLLVLTALACVADPVGYAFPGVQWLFYGTDWLAARYLFAYFLIGMLYATLDLRKYLNLQLAIFLMILLSGFHFDRPMQEFMVMMILPYFIFSFALQEKPLFARFGRKHDITYGVYLYGFFFQQLAAWETNMLRHTHFTFMMLFALSLIPTLLAAWLSCLLIEEPLQRLTGKILARWRGKGTALAHD